MNVFTNIVSIIKMGFFSKLIATNSGVSSKSFFLVVTTIVGVLLLIVPAGAIIVDLIFNHTVTMSWAEIGAYIGAVASLFATAGLTKAWSEKFEYNANSLNNLNSGEETPEDDINI